MNLPQASFSFDDSSPAAAALSRAAATRFGHYDELRGADGQLRPAWRAFFDALGSDDLGDLERRRAAIERQIRDDGITYNVYSDRAGDEPARLWPLDLPPFIIGAADWAQIERGVAQRAALLSRVLRDLYGPQTLLAEGLLPPALVFGHPGYLRPLAGVKPVGSTFLQIAAFDLARAADGQWWVVSQRTQAPSGLGYALQNRLIVARQFPEAFRALHVQRLASSFRRLLDTITRSAPRGDAPGEPGGAPRIVLLTPGPYNETYFEHAYLARYLGLPLVEGSDLTVRADQVFLKTVHGLERVHAILRRLDDDFCDPLELRPDSALGVPGLLQAIRAGQVLVANALGSAFLESPALQGFLPAISERLLQEPLALPSLASWWCGEQAAYEAVAGQLAEKVIKPTYPSRPGRPSFDAVIGAELSPAALDGLRALIDADPAAYTVQDYLPLSQASVWQDGKLLPRAAMVRVYAVADSDGRWHALPGGLTRIAGRAQRVVSMQRGGSSLDTWVQTEGQVDRYSMLPGSLRPEDLTRQRRPVTSRAGENLFWMGRYAERADHTARLAHAALTLLTGDTAPAPAVLAVLGRLCLEQGLVPLNTPQPAQGAAVFERTLLANLQQPNGGSVAFNLAAMQRAGAQIRERLSGEHWRLLQLALERFAERSGPAAGAALGQGAADAAAKPGRSRGLAIDALRRLSVDLAAVTGAQADRMTRDDGWRLLTVGRQIERLACLAGALAALEATGALADEAGFDLALALADSTVTYRALYQGRQELAPLVHLLVVDAANPRSLACVVELLRAELARLPAPPAALLALLAPPEQWPALERLCTHDAQRRLPALAGLVRGLRTAAFALSDATGARYFSHAAGYQVLG
ncbi:MAG: circularly permuted type 2 ATP-grasp protein [Burkholderiaceae bacterium]|nr:circularly permuted type 2 ATP-grasp protein [Burkholderiaceae bacterium]